MIASWLLRAGPWPWIALSVVDRLGLIYLFASRYVSTDDSVMWHAAVDFAHGRFHGPYFYGQSYGPMLEALVAAPLVRTGIPLNVLMPGVTSLLALLPYWSFALWFHRQGRGLAAMLMAALPLLMPVEFGLMTTMCRGFITGAAVLALLPWASNILHLRLRSFVIGAVVSVAWFVNPNSLIFSAPFLVHYLLTGESRLRSGSMTALGMVVGLSAHIAAQQWCQVHPERIVHTLIDPRPHFAPARIATSLGNLDAHFQWLMPVIWPYGSLLGIWLIVLIAVGLIRKEPRLAISLVIGAATICGAFTVDKVHDGWDSVFFPLSRMFLCLPLLVAWATAALLSTARTRVWMMGVMLFACCATATIHALSTERIARQQIHDLTRWVAVRPVPLLQDDAHRLRNISERYRIGLIVPLELPSAIHCQFRAYAYPVLEPALPPTYLAGYERRYWLRGVFSGAIVPNLLFVGGEPERWAALVGTDPRYMAIPDKGPDMAHVLLGNTLPTDSLVRSLMYRIYPEHK